jgi:hypothetical protein
VQATSLGWPSRTDAVGAEPLVHAGEAARRLEVPLYWLNQPRERKRRAIASYRVGKLLRFRLSELVAWAQALEEISNV